MNIVDDILQRIKERGVFAKITRLRYNLLTVDQALYVIEEIGKSRTPDFTIDKDNRFVYENFIKWIHGDSSLKALDPISGEVVSGALNKGIYIAGPTGTGKSWCLDIMREYSAACRYCVEVPGNDRSRREPLTWQFIRAKEVCDEYARTGNINQYSKRLILALQDLGSEPPEMAYMGNREDVIRQVLECRGDMNDCLTLISSNLRISGAAIEKRYGDRVASRLVEMCNYYELKGADRRKTCCGLESNVSLPILTPLTEY